MTGKRIIDIFVYMAFTATCVVLLGFLWVSVNLLSFPCDSPEDPRPCAQVVPWFSQRAASFLSVAFGL